MNLQTQSVARKQREELETPREQEHSKKSLSVQAVGELRFSKTLTWVFHSGDKYSASTDFHIFTFWEKNSRKKIMNRNFDNKHTRSSGTRTLQQLQQKQHKAQPTLPRSKEKCHTESVWKGSCPFPWLFGALRKCLSSVKQCKCLSRYLGESPSSLNKQTKLSRTKRGKKTEEKGRCPGSQKRSR